MDKPNIMDTIKPENAFTIYANDLRAVADIIERHSGDLIARDRLARGPGRVGGRQR